MLMARASNSKLNLSLPPAHLCDATYMNEILLTDVKHGIRPLKKLLVYLNTTDSPKTELLKNFYHHFLKGIFVINGNECRL